MWMSPILNLLQWSLGDSELVQARRLESGSSPSAPSVNYCPGHIISVHLILVRVNVFVIPVARWESSWAQDWGSVGEGRQDWEGRQQGFELLVSSFAENKICSWVEYLKNKDFFLFCNQSETNIQKTYRTYRKYPGNFPGNWYHQLLKASIFPHVSFK